MRISMNLLLWTGFITSEHFPLLAKLKQTGFDGVELVANLGPPRLVAVHLHLHVVGRTDDLGERRQLTERVRVGHAHVRARETAAGLGPEVRCAY